MLIELWEGHPVHKTYTTFLEGFFLEGKLGKTSYVCLESGYQSVFVMQHFYLSFVHV